MNRLFNGSMWLGAFVAALCAGCASTAALAANSAVWNFSNGADGNSPRGDLLPAAGNGFFGTAMQGGAAGDGTVFYLNAAVPTASTLTTIWNFTGGADGSYPSGGLVADASGALYGTTMLDGAGGAGTVFKLAPPAAGGTAWSETTLWSFTGGADGGQPMGSLIADVTDHQTLYGTTQSGGANGLGGVFSLHPPASGSGAWTETVLWSFTGGNDGARPMSALVQDAAGNLFGTARSGGASGVGVVFKLVPPAIAGTAWILTPIWTPSGGADGATPTGNLIFDSAGALYGTTKYGGTADCPMTAFPYYGEPNSITAPALNAPYVGPGGNGCGVVFKLARAPGGSGAWTQSVLWSFTGTTDGGNPVSGVVLVGQTLFGLAPLYGSPLGASERNDGHYIGNAYALAPPGQAGGPYSETSLSGLFTNQPSATYPRGNFVIGTNGNLVMTSSFGGTYWAHHSVYGFGTINTTPP